MEKLTLKGSLCFLALQSKLRFLGSFVFLMKPYFSLEERQVRWVCMHDFMFCHTVVWWGMNTVGCIIVGQGIVCLIHWRAISANTEPNLFLPTIMDGLPSIYSQNVVISLVLPLSSPHAGPLPQTDCHGLHPRSVLDCVLSFWLLILCCDVLVISAACKPYYLTLSQQHHIAVRCTV